MLVISHDRYFLDNVVTRTIEIQNGKAEFFGGNYSFYVEEKERRYQERMKKYEWEQAEAKRLRDAADRLYQWGTGNKNLMKKSFAIQSRIERLVQTERPVKEKGVGARFGEKAFRGDEALVLRGVSKSFDGKTLFSNVDLLVRGGERIALIGDNGRGRRPSSVSFWRAAAGHRPRPARPSREDGLSAPNRQIQKTRPVAAGYARL